MDEETTDYFDEAIKTEFIKEEVNVEELSTRLSDYHTQKKDCTSVNGGDTNLFECKTCDLTFTKQRYLNAHNKRKHAVNLFKCGYCEKKYVEKSRTEEHERRVHHAHDPFKTFKCDLCFKCFAKNDNVIKHKKECIIENEM